jgi:hypothetical protein
LVTTALPQDRDTPGIGELKLSKDAIPVPDRVFAITGNGGHGAITEFRNGLEAKIGLEMEYHTPVMQAWMFPPGLFDKPDTPTQASSILLSLGDRSSVLHISEDASQVEEIMDDWTDLDMQFRTITAGKSGNYGIQVTEKSIKMRNGPEL